MKTTSYNHIANCVHLNQDDYGNSSECELGIPYCDGCTRCEVRCSGKPEQGALDAGWNYNYLHDMDIEF